MTRNEIIKKCKEICLSLDLDDNQKREQINNLLLEQEKYYHKDEVKKLLKQIKNECGIEFYCAEDVEVWNILRSQPQNDCT